MIRVYMTFDIFHHITFIETYEITPIKQYTYFQFNHHFLFITILYKQNYNILPQIILTFF